MTIRSESMPRLTSRLSLNDADEAVLASVPVIGPERAHSIVKYRAEHGRFGSLDDLRNVPGIDDAFVTTLRGALSVEGRRDVSAARGADDLEPSEASAPESGQPVGGRQAPAESAHDSDAHPAAPPGASGEDF